MIISDIGTANDDTALLCHTNRPPDTPGGSDSGGQWFRPDQTDVLPGGGSVGFRRNRDPMVVRLWRNIGTTAVEGIYRCEVMDDTDTLQTVYVGLYNDDGGGNVLYV